MNVSFNHSKTYDWAIDHSTEVQHQGTIFFTTDTHQLVHNGNVYGISSEDKTALATILSAITNNNGQLETNTLPYALLSETQYNAENAQQDVFYFLYEDSWGFGDNFPVTLE